jgi:arylsulfatase
VIYAQGSRFGGQTLFVSGGQLFLGIPPEQEVVGAAPRSGRHIVGVEFAKGKMGERHEWHGTLKLHVDDQTIAESEIRTIASRYSLCGEGLCIGYDGGDAVSRHYGHRFEFTGGAIQKVIFDVADDAYVDVERELAAAFARD